MIFHGLKDPLESLTTIYSQIVLEQGFFFRIPLSSPAMSASKSGEQEQVCGVNDPIFLLRNEHTSLLGQLWLLEHTEKTNETIAEILQALMRDSEVHFKREALLLQALDEKLELGGRSFHRLVREHATLLKMARQFLGTRVLITGDSEGGECLAQQLGEFVRQFLGHINHVEKVVYLLARTRLSRQHQKQLAKLILTV